MSLDQAWRSHQDYPQEGGSSDPDRQVQIPSLDDAWKMEQTGQQHHGKCYVGGFLDLTYIVVGNNELLIEFVQNKEVSTDFRI